MKEFFSKLKEDFKHPYIYIMMVLTAGIVLVSIFYFGRSYIRIYEACKDIASSFIYAGKSDYTASVTLIPDNYYTFSFNINVDWYMFSIEFRSWWFSLWNMDTFNGYVEGFVTVIMIFMMAILVVLLIVILVWFLFKRYFKESNRKDNHDSVPLKCYKAIQNKVFKPIKNFILNCWDYLMDNRWIYYIWAILFFLDFNLLTIILEFFAYYFYFIFSFDFIHLYIQLYKLIADLSVMITFIPALIGIVIYILYLVHKRRINKGYSRLEKMETNNKAFVGSLGISTMICGEMGIGKTSTLTDMSLSCNQYFRYQAFERLLQQDLKFPNFPWVLLEDDLNECIENHYTRLNDLSFSDKYHDIYSLASVRIHVGYLRDKYFNDPCKENLFMYDVNVYPECYYDGKTINDIWSTIETYSLLYFIYVSESSLIVSNYSIRDDDGKLSNGHFPLWDMNFFRRSYSSVFDKHSHILDFDSTRLGQLVSDHPIYNDALEFGVIVITEGGKERPNQLGTRSLSASDIFANQKNDNFNLWVKMARHSATVDNFPFIKILFDEQRAMSFGADLREICQNVIFLEDETKNQCCLSLHSLGGSLINRFTNWFRSSYYEYRYARGDNTLFMYLVKGISAYFIRREEKIKNTFGYSKLCLEIESGSLDKENSRHHDYYLCYHKIYSNRYSSDCFNAYFEAKNKQSKYGLNDLPTYSSTTASIQELLQQNSYFINDLTNNIFWDDLKRSETPASSESQQGVNEVTSFKKDEEECNDDKD